MHEAVSGGNVWLDDCCIHSTALHCDYLISAIVDNVEVKELFVNICWDLDNLLIEENMLISFVIFS